MSNGRHLQQNHEDYVLLSQIQKENQVLIRDDSIIYLSTEDNVAIGEGTKFGGYHNKVYLYAEQFTLSGAFKLSHGILSASQMSTLGEATFDLQGKPGSTTVEGTDDMGGADGGDLSLFIENAAVNVPHFMVNASGGNGGNGSSSKAKGGDGGNGGSGGKVRLLYGHPYLKLVAELRNIFHNEDKEDKIEKLNGFLERNRDAAPLEPFRQKLKDAASAETANAVIKEMASRLIVLADGWKSQALASTDISGGMYGAYGEGLVNGNNGKNGARGMVHIMPVSSAAQMENMQEEFFFLGYIPFNVKCCLRKPACVISAWSHRTVRPFRKQ